DEVGHGSDLQLVSLGELLQIGEARHRPVVAHDLADDAGRLEAREACQVDGSFRLARAYEDPSLARDQREDVPWGHQVLRGGTLADGGEDRGGPVCGGLPVA